MIAKSLQLVCPAGNPAALRAAVDAGGDVVYVGFRDQTNARNFPGLNFSRKEMATAIAYAHDRDAEVYIAINTYPEPGAGAAWRQAVDDAAALRADAVILADIGLLDYASKNHPDLRRHLSVQASAANEAAIKFYHDAFAISRIVLPRVLTVANIAALIPRIPVETEVFAFGGMCPMAEGRCLLSSYITGKSPNIDGVCSPASHVRYVTKDSKLYSQLGGSTVNIFEARDAAGYPTLCKGRFTASGETGYLFEEPTSLNVIPILPDLINAGVSALKIEGRQRGKAYTAQVVASFRAAVDACLSGQSTSPAEIDLSAITEGNRDTAGAYKRNWR